VRLKEVAGLPRISIFFKKRSKTCFLKYRRAISPALPKRGESHFRKEQKGKTSSKIGLETKLFFFFKLASPATVALFSAKRGAGKGTY
jgi:hypothetical protein